jgi:ceramide glucosyltransferase
LIADQGLEVKLLPYTVQTVADFYSLRDLLHKRLRWMTVMRCMRPWGHFGLLFTFGLLWASVAFAAQPSVISALSFFGGYLAFRFAITWLVGIRGMGQSRLWRQLLFVPLWDLMALLIWIASFCCRTIRWRGVDYAIRDGLLVPASPKYV